MSAETLRRAAALMRERAEVATPGPWAFDEIGSVWSGEGEGPFTLIFATASDPDAAHIASWHPAVALAVADWLERSADRWTYLQTPNAALAVARAYLGEA